MPIDLNTKITQVLQHAHKIVPKLFCEAIEKLHENTDYILEKQSEDPEKALRTYPRLPEDGKIDWTQNSSDIIRLINASNKPYAGAFCSLNSKPLKIWDAKLSNDNENFLAMPGQVTKVNSGYIDVACIDEQKIRIFEAEYEGDTRSPDHFIKTIRVRLY